jgi:hypothetical protein
MRLGEWRKAAPNKDSMNSRVLAILRPVLVDLGADADAECWVAWGEDPESRYSVLAPTAAGLITVAIRLTGPDGARATGKLIRWSKLSVSELGIESSGGHRLVAVQVESHVLKGIDTEADRICEFVRGLIASIDGRNPTMIPVAVMPGLAAAGAAGVIGGAAAVAAAAAMDDDDVDAAHGGASPEHAAGGAAGSKPPAASGPRSVPPAEKGAPKPAGKPAPKSGEKPAGLALVPAAKPAQPAPAATPAPPAGVQQTPTPIAARAAAAHHPEHPAPGSGPAAPVPPPEPDRSEWIGPHPIEEQSGHEPAKPRPWKP